ncbi:MAG: transglycosylase domain-containing protein [Sulfuricella sp.]|nr:transglycosylase domain-containing protein [Sulfuricella sp.]
MITTKKKILRRSLYAVSALALAALAVAGFLAFREAQTSALQARYLSGLAKQLGWKVEKGPNRQPRIPQDGPYDRRMGYALLPAMLPRLATEGFQVSAQARISPRMQEVVDRGLFIPYREKNQAGLAITDFSGRPLFRAISPTRVYDSFEAIPPVVVNSLLYIENRNLLDPAQPKKNPAVNWARLGQAVLDKLIQLLRPEHEVPGGSTLATQIEKYRHSPNGMTLTAADKLQQIESASVRAYLGGENTLPVRRRIALAYLNTVPLAAVPGFGEVNGIGDGLWAWYGWDFNYINRILRAPPSGADLAEFASAYKHVLSLFIAQRRPSAYLGRDHRALEELTDSHLRVLAQAGVISPALRDAALKARLRFLTAAVPEENGGYAPHKAANAVRVQLASLLGMSRLYDVDRLDLSVQSALDGALQKKTTTVLHDLRHPDYARAAGLYGYHLLSAGDDLDKIIYSFTLHELTPQGAKLRIQADNFDQPFDINQGTKLDLGSTAKLRTLVTYLEIVAKLHGQYAGLSPEALRKVEVEPSDKLTQWAIDYLAQSDDRSLSAMLDAALERRYSASPGERFFTGGGVHVFHNFKHEDDGRIMSVREATRNSVNLVYIRLMRDIVRYYMFQIPGSSARILKDADDPLRAEYLRRFADKESREFIGRFYLKYRGKPTGERIELFFAGVRPSPHRLAAAYRYLFPQATLARFGEFMEARLPGFNASDEHDLQKMYDRYGPGKFSLADQGYLAHVHPLELWLVGYLASHPAAQYRDVIAASGKERIEVYDWLLKTVHKNAQDKRIRSLLEVEAFLEIQRKWKRLGYPFDTLVPSLATAIGSSADRPAALAELMGIILNNGVRLPTVTIERMHFGAGTPFDTVVEHAAIQGERLFAPELSAAIRSVLIDVVENGTATRLSHAIVREDGTQIQIGGKTGTGDQRYVTFSGAGVIKESRAVNRSATFVFFIGDRFFGTLTAFVPGADAADYTFTSALPAQILKHLLPALKPLTESAQPVPEQVYKAAASTQKAPKSEAPEEEEPTEEGAKDVPAPEEETPERGKELSE